MPLDDFERYVIDDVESNRPTKPQHALTSNVSGLPSTAPETLDPIDSKEDMPMPSLVSAIPVLRSPLIDTGHIGTHFPNPDEMSSHPQA